MADTPIYRSDLNDASHNIVSENIDYIKQRFPHVVNESGVDFDALKQTLGGVVDTEHHYNFSWHGKRKAERIAYTPTRATLLPVPQESKHWDSTKNMVIEGDNLEVLKLLQKSYSNKIKMIYIDPPYNTGNDFVYDDDYTDNLKNYLIQTGQMADDGTRTHAKKETAGRKHTNWLNMIYPRLLLARNLLTEYGVIFISIDDNEQANLKKVCDEVFGEENFIGTLIHQRAKGGGQAKTIVKGHDYIHIYSKQNVIKLIRKKVIQSKTTTIDGKEYIINDDVLRKVFGKYDKNLGDGDRRCVYEDIEIYHSKNKKKEIDKQIKQGTLFLNQREDGKHIICKRIPADEAFSKLYSILSFDLEKTTLKYLSENGSNQLEALGLNKVFNNPKDINLIKFLVYGCTTQQNDIILDFFAGSSTTAHAVMALNAEDGGSRKCISVQLPELTDTKSEAYKAGYKNIAEITKERIRRAGDALVADSKDTKTNLDIGFKVFKLAESNVKPWQADFDSLEQDLLDNISNLLAWRTDTDIVTEIALKYGLCLTENIQSHAYDNTAYYAVDGTGGIAKLFVCLQADISTDIVHCILNENPKTYPYIKVVFADSCFDNAEKATVYHTLTDAHIGGVSFL